MSVKIITNHHRRDILDAYQIPPDVRERFDYVDWSACDDGRDSVSFVHAYGEWWDLGDLSGTRPGIGDHMPDSLSSRGWHAYDAQTYFSGYVFRWLQDDRLDTSGDWYVVVGKYVELGD